MNSEAQQFLSRLEFVPVNPMFPARGGVSVELLRQICKEYPDGVTSHGWEIVGAPYGDAYILEVLNYARQIGVPIPVDQSEVRTGVDYRIYPSKPELLYKQSAFTRAILVGSVIARIGFMENGEPYVIHDAMLDNYRNRNIGGAFAFPSEILVRSGTKDQLLEAGLAGLSLRRLPLTSQALKKGQPIFETEWPKGIEPLYQVYSDVELPICKNWMFDNAGRVFHPRDRDSLPDGCMPLNGLEPLTALHYSRNEIESFLGFDVVRTYERYWGNGPVLLVSKRFRKLVKDLRVKGMNYEKSHYVVIDETPWKLGVEGPRHPRYSGPAPNPPVD